MQPLKKEKKKSFMSVINQTEGGLKTKHALVTGPLRKTQPIADDS